MKSSWQLQTPIDAVIFDCDGTLSTIEGIDALAKSAGVEAKVSALTEQAMGKTGINPGLYQERLDFVFPTKQQVSELGQLYFDCRVPDAIEVIHLLQRLQKSVYIISAGLYPAVESFGKLLGIPRENIFAVDIQFDSLGNYSKFDQESPLVDKAGKRIIVNQLKQKHADIVYVGDGLNDYAVYDLATRFIGYGGAFYRENIASRCEYYIKSASIAPLLPLSLTQVEEAKLTLSEQSLFQQGLMRIEQGEVIIR